MLKALYVADKGTYLIKMPRGSYQIDGKNVEFECYSGEKIELTKVDDIREVSTSKIRDRYENSKGEVLTQEDYDAKIKILQAYGKYDEDSIEYSEYEEDSTLFFEEIEDEVRYKRFLKEWVQCYKSITTIGDILPVAIGITQMDTGCKYVTPMWQFQNNLDPMCYYNRSAALINTVIDTFAELHMKHDGDCNYEKTKNRKIYGYSDSSSLRFWKAFGTYIFNDRHWAVVNNNITGTMDDLLQRYKNDRTRMENEIKARYASHFVTDEGRAIQVLRTFVGDISNLRSRVGELNVKAKSSSDHRMLMVKFNELQEKMNEVLADIVRT